MNPSTQTKIVNSLNQVSKTMNDLQQIRPETNQGMTLMAHLFQWMGIITFNLMDKLMFVIMKKNKIKVSKYICYSLIGDSLSEGKEK